MTTLRGGPELRARLRAIKTVFKPLGRAWADSYVALARPRLPAKTGKLRRSLRRRNASMKRATIVASYTAFFIDHGTIPHVIKPKTVSGSRRGGPGTAKTLVFNGRKGTIFTKAVNHRGIRARPFRKYANREALRLNPMALFVVKAWNAAVR